MATRGSKLQRAIDYFREAPVDEMRVAFQLAKEVVDRRLSETQPAANKPVRKRRTRKLTVAPVAAEQASVPVSA